MKKIVRRLLPDVLLVVGVAAIVAALYAVCPPLAIAAGGVCAVLMAILLSV